MTTPHGDVVQDAVEPPWHTYRAAMLAAPLEFPSPLVYYSLPGCASEDASDPSAASREKKQDLENNECVQELKRIRSSVEQQQQVVVPQKEQCGPALEAHRVSTVSLSAAALGAISRDFRERSKDLRAHLEALPQAELRALARSIHHEGSGDVHLMGSSVVLLPSHVVLSEADGILGWFALTRGGWLSASGAPSAKVTRQWAREGATCVVSLLRDSEPHFQAARDACLEAGFRWEHAPLSGKTALMFPDETDRESWTFLSELLPRLLDEGEHVVVHCAAGMHRTGGSLFLALRLSGLSPEATLTAVQHIRPVTHSELLKTEKRTKKCLWEAAEDTFGALRVPLPSAAS